MKGFYVWGGSLIKTGGKYHLFASRWPKETGFPEGYRSHSEIVRAISDTPLGPYLFQEVVLAGRGGGGWDGMMCHNPKITQFEDTFILYYIGSALRDKHRRRKIGYAYSKSIEGPWTRLEKSLPFGKDHNNPAPYFHKDGCILVAFRDHHLKMHIAHAEKWNGDYKIIAKNVIPQARVEDPDLFKMDGLYHMVVEDNRAGLTGRHRFGALLTSHNGVKWQLKEDPIVYTHTIEWEDGSSTTVSRRERPELVNLSNNRKEFSYPTHLLTAIHANDESWCHIQAFNIKK